MSEIKTIDGVDTHPDWSQVPEHARHVFLCTGVEGHLIGGDVVADLLIKART